MNSTLYNNKKEHIYAAKRLDTGEWLIGHYFCMHHNDNRNHVHHFIIPLDTDLSKGTPIEKIQVEIQFESLCENTGERDCADNLIFEGHILYDQENPEENAFVEYEDGGFVVKSDLGCQWNMQDIDMRGFEIIGNKFDNPELIQG